jgi:hypothetical protein
MNQLKPTLKPIGTDAYEMYIGDQYVGDLMRDVDGFGWWPPNENEHGGGSFGVPELHIILAFLDDFNKKDEEDNKDS